MPLPAVKMAVGGPVNGDGCQAELLKRWAFDPSPKPQLIIPLPMSVFEGPSEFVIHGGQFNQVTGNLYQLGPHDDSGQSE